MTTRRTQPAAMKQATAVIIVAMVIAVREAYTSGSRGYYAIAILLLIFGAMIAGRCMNNHGKSSSGKTRER